HLRLAAELNFDAGARQAQLVRLNVAAPAGNVRADGMLALDPRVGESRLDADVRQLDTLALTKAFASPYDVASRVDGHVSARWPVLEYTRAGGEAHLTLTPTHTTTASARRTVQIAGKLDVASRDNVITADATQLQALGATLDGRVSLTNPLAVGLKSQ